MVIVEALLNGKSDMVLFFWHSYKIRCGLIFFSLTPAGLWNDSALRFNLQTPRQPSTSVWVRFRF
jgi:hypothetical protein